MANELSFDGQFDSHDSYVESLTCLMLMRQEARKHGFNIQCTKTILDTDITKDINFRQSLQKLGHAQRMAVLQWITQSGPFWDESKCHSSDEYFEMEDGEVVTDSCLAEAAFHNLNGNSSNVVSLLQPHWSATEIPIIWHRDSGEQRVEVKNLTQRESLLKRLEEQPKPIVSWEQLEERCKERCMSLFFSDSAFAGLKGTPFVACASSRILELLLVLDKFNVCFNDAGERNEEGHRIYQEHFTGDKAWFSDSSDTEKREFKEAQTFKHPENNGESIFCTWHGKVKTPQIRIHHSWPITKDAPLYIMYIGPKLTKR
ncbi:hypothetical protein [Vibrio diabolicus]|uniref:hypothetical protein n=1 Tax=Vibrio diabolicus TaxID=50719 RepID=UPI00215F3802|nr:hypothetical protein [Vibrio diabolicus]EIE9609384.1 hypothetical protein [Vibrio parahaemolyticus]MCS0317289.1 hypothetical protein [Vibrio diabolicus]